MSDPNIIFMSGLLLGMIGTLGVVVSVMEFTLFFKK